MGVKIIKAFCLCFVFLFFSSLSVSSFILLVTRTSILIQLCDIIVIIYSRDGQPAAESNSCLARQAPNRKNWYGWILCVPLLELWMQPATKITTLFRPAVVKWLPTTDVQLTFNIGWGHTNNKMLFIVAILFLLQDFLPCDCKFSFLVCCPSFIAVFARQLMFCKPVKNRSYPSKWWAWQVLAKALVVTP